MMVSGFTIFFGLERQSVFSRCLKFLYHIGWEFWLPLPLIAALFWSAGHGMTARVLNRSYGSVNPLQADTRLDAKLSITILSINAEIHRDRGVTTILIRTTDPTLKRLEYEFPVIQATQAEAALAQELEIPADRVKKLISYRIID
jgi:hypothetical protein